MILNLNKSKMKRRFQFIKRIITLAVFLPFLFVSLKVNAQVTTEVKTTSELLNAISGAKPGDLILLEDGDFKDGAIRISAKGTSEKPIVVKAKNMGKAIFTVPVKIEGEFLSISGISFSEHGSLEISGKNCRISRCTWSDAKSGKWIRVMPGSSQIEIDHNLFENKTNNKELEKSCQLIQITVRNENEHHHVHHNLFLNIPKGKTGNGFETLQLITENNPFDPPGGHSNSIIEDNLFIRCNGESEIISVKSNGNIIRRNTFRACAGSLVLRHGDDNVAIENFFFGDGEKDSGGVRLQGTGQIVANNYFQELGQLSLGMMDGTPDNLYIRVQRAQILFNTFINCKKTFVIGMNHPSHPNGTVPQDCKIAGNLFFYDELSKPENIIEWVQNDQPENWTWEDNIAFGAEVPKDIVGIQNKNTQLEFHKNGLWLPTSKTPKAEHQISVNDERIVDRLNLKWEKKRSLGAIQYPINLSVGEFLTEDKVGPFAK